MANNVRQSLDLPNALHEFVYFSNSGLSREDGKVSKKVEERMRLAIGTRDHVNAVKTGARTA